MSNKFQNFKTKLQENRKFQIQFASVVAACVVVLACAITIPVAVHNSNIKKAMMSEVENSTSDIAITEEMSEPETTANEATTLADETLTTAAPTSAIADVENKTTPNNNNNSNGGSGNKGNNGGSSNGSAGSKKPTQPMPSTSAETTTDRYHGELSWTQADVDATVAKVRRYAISKGFAIDSTLTEIGTSWDSPLDTRWDYKSRGVSDLEYQVDRLYDGIIQDFGYFPEGADLNIFSKNCGGYWEIYVVY